MIKRKFVMAGLTLISLAAFASGNPFALVGKDDRVDGEKIIKTIVNKEDDNKIEQQSTSTSSSISYKYDALGRLVCVIDNVAGNREFVYDDAGNRSKVSLSSCN